MLTDNLQRCFSCSFRRRQCQASNTGTPRSVCCPDLSLDIVHLGSDVVISLQVLCRWLCQLLAIIPGMANDKRETEAAAEVKKWSVSASERRGEATAGTPALNARAPPVLWNVGKGTALPSSAACRQWKNGLHPCRLGWWMASTTRATSSWGTWPSRCGGLARVTG